MIWSDELKQALQTYREARFQLGVFARPLADPVIDNLRELNHSQLKALKTKLKDYNVHTGSWTR